MCRESRDFQYWQLAEINTERSLYIYRVRATVRGPASGVRGPDLLPFLREYYFQKLEKLYQKMSSDTFYVVVTEKWAAAVPSTWVLPDVMTVWWPKGETVTLAASKKRKPESSWSKTTYQYLVGPFDTYIEARKMEKSAICISTDDDTEALLSKFPSDKSKRKKKDNRQDDFLYGSDLATKSSSDDNDDDDSDDDNAARRPQDKSFTLKPLPECPIGDVDSGISTNVQSTELEAGTCSLSLQKQTSELQKQTDACTTDPPLHRKRKRLDSTPINDSSGSSSSTAEFSLSNSCTENDSEDVSRIRHGNFCCAGCRQEITFRFKKLSRKLNGLTLLLENNNNEVNTNSAASKKIPHVTELPVQTLPQFTEFEKKLKEDIQLRHNFRTCRRSFQTLLLENLRCHFKNGYVEVEIKFAVIRDLQVGHKHT